jgi:chemotaxis protein methyltransferase CheR
VSGLAAQGDDYLEFCEGIRSLTGIDLAQYKRGQMERRIRSFAESRGAISLPDYLRRLSQDTEARESFLDRMTINVSQLWRNPEQWDRLAATVLPELASAGRIRCWSAGCSYGAEAYTLAAVCRSTVPTARPEVHGTDIDARMVERARAGVFTEADARAAPPAELERWFERTDQGQWQARAELRMLTKFETGDLLRDRFPRAGYDLVLCRNVVIYFTEPVRDALHARLAEALRPGGYLLIGSTERIGAPAAIGLEPVHPFLYRRV